MIASAATQAAAPHLVAHGTQVAPTMPVTRRCHDEPIPAPARVLCRDRAHRASWPGSPVYGIGGLKGNAADARAAPRSRSALAAGAWRWRRSQLRDPRRLPNLSRSAMATARADLGGLARTHRAAQPVGHVVPCRRNAGAGCASGAPGRWTSKSWPSTSTRATSTSLRPGFPRGVGIARLAYADPARRSRISRRWERRSACRRRS